VKAHGEHDTGLARYGFLHDVEGRARRGKRIVALLRACFRSDLGAMRTLDVGCSAGLIANEIAREVGLTIGIDPDVEAVMHAQAYLARPGTIMFACASGESLPFADAQFDLVLCNHVYEHADDALALMAEVARVLAPGGACWFAGGHTWQLIEPHYRLPLLALMPRALASWCVRARGLGDAYSIKFLAPWRVPALFGAFADARLVSVDALRDPVRFDLAVGPLRFALVRSIVRRLARPLAWFAPTQFWILRKDSPADGPTAP
jgi:SAM-dependent methyltransferase